MIIIIGVADIIQNFVLPNVYGEDDKNVQITAMVFILLRTIRVFRLLEVFYETLFEKWYLILFHCLGKFSKSQIDDIFLIWYFEKSVIWIPMFPCNRYSQFLLSPSPRDSLKYLEISIPQRIRTAELL